MKEKFRKYLLILNLMLTTLLKKEEKSPERLKNAEKKTPDWNISQMNR